MFYNVGTTTNQLFVKKFLEIKAFTLKIPLGNKTIRNSIFAIRNPRSKLEESSLNFSSIRSAKLDNCSSIISDSAERSSGIGNDDPFIYFSDFSKSSRLPDVVLVVWTPLILPSSSSLSFSDSNFDDLSSLRNTGPKSNSSLEADNDDLDDVDLALENNGFSSLILYGGKSFKYFSGMTDFGFLMCSYPEPVDVGNRDEPPDDDDDGGGRGESISSFSILPLLRITGFILIGGRSAFNRIGARTELIRIGEKHIESNTF
ncbi:hypothetical protein BLOT_001985 [Blomia tropicalis]|nr:hypothetical protein BLOT_001985 [Blomia tropicalis]